MKKYAKPAVKPVSQSTVLRNHAWAGRHLSPVL